MKTVQYFEKYILKSILLNFPKDKYKYGKKYKIQIEDIVMYLSDYENYLFQQRMIEAAIKYF